MSKILCHVDCVCLSEGWGSSCQSHPLNEVCGHGLPLWLVDYVVDKATPCWLAICLERRHFARWDDSWKLSRNKQEGKPKRLGIPSKKDWKKKQKKAYSGNSAGKEEQAAVEKKTKGGICDVCPLEAVKRLQKLGYLKTVSRCPTCDVGRLSEQFVWQGVTK